MTSPDPTDILGQINSAREQTYQNIATAQGILDQANAAASAAAQDRAAIQAIAQQTVRVDTSVGTRVFAGDTMIFGDTGWRMLRATDLLNGWAVATQHLGPQVRRIGDIVQMYIPSLGLDGANRTNGTFWVAPSGFRPVYNYATLGEVFGDNAWRRVAQDVDALVIIDSPKAQVSGNLWWRTSQSWPTSLPGTLAA